MDIFYVVLGFMAMFATCLTKKLQKEGNCTLPDEFAVCNLVANPNKPSDINGTIYFWQAVTPQCTRDFLSVQVNIDHLPHNDHTLLRGFHIHEHGDVTEGCESMGPHYNPRGAPHGYGWNSPDARHVGDLGNVRQYRNKARVEMRFVDYLAQLAGPESIIGRGIVLHADEDDLGMVDNTGSKTTGNAGARLACCVIGRCSPISPDKFTLYK